MQSYEEHLISHFLQDRLPYLDQPFTSDIDPNQVTLAVFERKIPKLAECLRYPELPDDQKRDALHTLNEMTSNQELKDEMIQYDILSSCATLLFNSCWPVRMESALLVGGLVSMMHGRAVLIDSGVFDGVQQKLTDERLEVRQAVAWALTRLSNSRDGVEQVLQSGTIPFMVQAFIQHAKQPRIDENKYLLYLLEGFINITEYDNGIEPMLGTGIIGSLVAFLKSVQTIEPYKEILTERTLHCLMHLGLHPMGKDEANDVEALTTVVEFLRKHNTHEQKRLASGVVMSVTIALNGKHQAVALTKGTSPILIQRLFMRLRERDPDIWMNAMQALHNISDLPIGFEKAAAVLSNDLQILDEVLGYRAVKPLAALLPKLNKYQNPPRIPEDELPVYQRYIKGIEYLIKQHDEAVSHIIDTVNIAEKLGPFLTAEYEVDRETVFILKKVLGKDTHNRQILHDFVVTYGDETKIKANLVKYPEITNHIYQAF